MTDRLYYDDAYLTEFDATVTECEAAAGGFRVRVDRSAFYPTSGGQPFDTGTLGGASVLDVSVSVDGDVDHLVDRPFNVGESVHGVIDWPRRFDHMQQHAGDHMIASALWRLYGGVTIGLHLSHEVSTIDVAMPEGVTHLSSEDIRKIEADVNERIQRDVPIHCWFPKEDELKRLPLRKPPTVTEHVRVVAIGEDEMVACGGTHPRSAGELGLVKIVGAAPARGKLRVSFLSGNRALRDYLSIYDIAHETAALLSTAVENLPAHVASLRETLRQAEWQLNRLRRDEAVSRILSEDAPALPDGTRVAAMMLEGNIDLIKDVASEVIKRPKMAVLLGVMTEADRAAFVFARSADVDIHMGQLLMKAAKPLGGKGGGRPDFAQGGGTPEILEATRRLIL